MKVGELFFQFGAEGLDKVQAGVNTLSISVASLTAAFIASATGLGVLANQTIKYTETIRDFNRQTGISGEILQRYGQVATQTGSDIDTIKGAFTGLNNKVEEFKLGMGDLSPFARFGISLRNANGELKNGVELFESIREKFQQFDVGKRTAMLDKLGIDKNLIDLLSLTNEEFDRLTDRDLIISDEGLRQMQTLKNTFAGVLMTVKRLADLVMVSLAPEFIKALGIVKEFIYVNKDGLMNGLRETAEVAGWFLKAISNSVLGVIEFTDATIGLKNALFILAGAFALTPFGRFLTILTGIIAALDDIYTFFKGGESITGDIVGRVQEQANEFQQGTFLENEFARWKNLLGFNNKAGEVAGNSVNNMQQSHSRVNNVDASQKIDIQIITDNPQEAGASVESALTRQIRETQAYFTENNFQ